ncbi:OmpA family protein [Aquimarina spongiae]|uniref:OmpA family protein n=1 Tax=Aquimarina spongiae TaxID=570521 RepID=A0A1M6IXZ0_9FLAO|nr:OmpA family protein [Aquimarina spongiae]SHJ39301.1 OmpA family protein [Aquimarina spongiae]
MRGLTIILVGIALCISQNAEAQFWKKIAKKAEEKAKEVVIQKTGEKVAQKTSKTIDKTLEKNPRGTSNENGNQGTMESETETVSEKEYGNITMYTKFDFVAGNDILFYDDFSLDNLGDFPSKWDTDGTGELVEVLGRKWLKMSDKSNYLPLLDQKLPKEYTIEFDMMLTNYPANNGGVGSRFWVCLDEDESYKFRGKNRVEVSVGFWTALKNQVWINNRVNGKHLIGNNIDHVIHEEFYQPAHISIAVNKTRFRMWVNKVKIVDVPRLVPNVQLSKIKLHMKGYADDFLISDFKFAVGGQDIRGQLIEEGKFSTNAIQFDSGSAVLKPESFGILKRIANALQQDNFTIHIIGHTDDEGDEESNLILSEQRAEAVKDILVSQFNIDETLLSIEGRGEAEPVADNSLLEGKAKNRRVEFIKL